MTREMSIDNKLRAIADKRLLDAENEVRAIAEKQFLKDVTVRYQASKALEEAKDGRFAPLAAYLRARGVDHAIVEWVEGGCKTVLDRGQPKILSPGGEDAAYAKYRELRDLPPGKLLKEFAEADYVAIGVRGRTLSALVSERQALEVAELAEKWEISPADAKRAWATFRKHLRQGMHPELAEKKARIKIGREIL